MIYNLEKADQPDLDKPIGKDPLSTKWQPELLGGVVAIKGTWADGSPLLAIPNYVRLNRAVSKPEGDRSPTSVIWIKK
jgi:hypothetical protein